MISFAIFKKHHIRPPRKIKRKQNLMLLAFLFLFLSCGENAACNAVEGECGCLPGYFGDPKARCLPKTGKNLTLKLSLSKFVVKIIYIPVYIYENYSNATKKFPNYGFAQKGNNS